MRNRLPGRVAPQTGLGGVGHGGRLVNQHVIPGLVTWGLSLVGPIPAGVGLAVTVAGHDNATVSVATMFDEVTRLEFGFVVRVGCLRKIPVQIDHEEARTGVSVCGRNDSCQSIVAPMPVLYKPKWEAQHEGNSTIHIHSLVVPFCSLVGGHVMRSSNSRRGQSRAAFSAITVSLILLVSTGCDQIKGWITGLTGGGAAAPAQTETETASTESEASAPAEQVAPVQEQSQSTPQPAEPVKPPVEEFIATLGGPQTSNEDLEMLASYESGQELLTELDLSGSQVTGAGIAHLANCPNLTKLELIGMQWGANDFAPVGDIASIEELIVQKSTFDDSAAQEVSRLPALRSINMTSTRISDAGLAALSNVQTP